MRAHHVGIAVVVAFGFGCGDNSGDATTGADAAAMEPALSPPAPAGGQQVASDTYKLPAGSEHYMCYQFRSPADAVAVTHVDSISETGVHHLALFQVTPGHDEIAAAHECDDLIKETWLPVFVSGTGSHDLSMPAGVGETIAPNTQYVLQLHLLNSTDADIDVRAGVNLTYDHSPTGLQQAGIYGIGNTEITIPPGATDYTVTEHCAIDKTLNVFGVFPHMHKLGTEFDVTQGSAATPFYTVNPWAFGNQPIAPMVTTLTTADTIDVTCHWNNPGTTPVTYGESTTNEMCYFVMFYYPYDGLDGCVD
jgi:hypothetical protein